LLINPQNIYASNSINARIENRYYETLEEAIAEANSTDIIFLTNDIKLNKTLEINKTVNINLNSHSIKSDEKVFLVEGGSLNLSGKGTVSETKPNYGAIMIIGSEDPSKKDYSTINIGDEITLEGWSGIFINHKNKTGYGILVNINGNINAINDISGSPGAGIYINGNIKNQSNSPIINLNDTTKITSTGNGIYAAGYATFNINGAYISGEESAIGIKAGKFNIANGTIVGIGEDKTPTSGNNNGINASGTAIQIESNPGYAGNIELNIENGKIESKYSNVIYEYTTANNTTAVKNINISGGTYISNAKKNVFSLSDKFKNTHQNFITGGIYSSDPTEYLKSGYSSSKNEKDFYEVISNVINVFAVADKNKKTAFTITTALLTILVIIVYLNRYKIPDLINLIKRKGK